MPQQIIKQDVTLVAAGGTTSLSTSTVVDVYRVITAAPITLLANVSITYTGSLVTGLLYTFEYDADVTLDGNTISFFGETMPSELANKECKITAYYNGSAWTVQFVPSINEVGVIPEQAFGRTPYLLIDGNVSTAGVNSTNTIAEETLSSVSVGADTLRTDRDMLYIIAFGTTAANANTKTIRLKSSSAGTIIANATSTAPNNRDWVIEGYIMRSTSTNAVQNGKITISGSATDTNASTGGGLYDWTGSETFTITSECGTGAVGNVVLHGFIVYKIDQAI